MSARITARNLCEVTFCGPFPASEQWKSHKGHRYHHPLAIPNTERIGKRCFVWLSHQPAGTQGQDDMKHKVLSGKLALRNGHRKMNSQNYSGRSGLTHLLLTFGDFRPPGASLFPVRGFPPWQRRGARIEHNLEQLTTSREYKVDKIRQDYDHDKHHKSLQN